MGFREDALLDALARISRGEVSANLVTLLYDELRNLARAMKARRPRGETLQTTELLHEAYLRLVGGDNPEWNGRAHFFGAAARAMRQILVDQARHKGRFKRGGRARRVVMGEIESPIQVPAEDIVAVHAALERLEEEDPRRGDVVNLRFFVGLTAEETADALGVSVSTVEREWRFARAWLYAQLRH